MQYIERKGRQPKPPKSSNNTRLETLFSTADYLNREYTIAVPTTALYIDPKVPHQVRSVMEENLRVVLTPTQYRQLDRRTKRQVEIRASSGENGRVLEADNPIIMGEDEHILSSKGGGATSYIRTGGIYYRQKVDRIYGPADANPIPELFSMAFSLHWGWMDYKEAYEELVRSQDLEALGVHCEKNLGIYRINALPDPKGVLQPIDYFKANGILPESADPVLLFRALRENIRLQDIARLEDLGQPESAGKLIGYGAQAFAKGNGIAGPFSEENYFVELSKKVTQDLLPLFLRGYKFATHSWHDVARNISVVGENVDVGGFKAIDRNFRDIGDFLYSQGDYRNTFYLTSFVLLRLAEQIKRHTGYKLVDAADILEDAASGVIEATNFDEILSQIKDTEVYKYDRRWGRRVGADELQGMTKRHMYELIDKFRETYGKYDISQWVFRPSSC